MASDQNIGAVSVTISGDYSQLEQDFNTTQTVAAEAGQQIAGAFTNAAAGADVLSQATATAVDSMGSFDVATQSFIRFRTEAEAIDKEWADALVENAERARKAAEEPVSAFEKFADSIAEFIEHPLETAASGAKSFILALGPVGTIALAAGAALMEVGHIITELVMEEAQAARATENLALRLNLTWEEAKHLSEMAKVVDVDMGVLTRTSMRLADAMEDPTGSGKKVAEALENMGSAALYSDKPILTLLEDLSKIPDAAERISAAHQVMGRSAVQLEPLLADYAKLNELIESLGGKLDKEAIDKLLETNKQSKALGIAWDHFKESLAVTFSPAVTAGLQMLSNLVSGGKTLTLDAQIAKLKEEIASLGVQANQSTIAVTSMMGGGMVSGQANAAMLQQKKDLLGLLEREKSWQDLVAESDKAGAEAKMREAAAARDAEEAAKRNYERGKINIDAAVAEQISLVNADREGIKAREALGMSSASDDIQLLRSLNQQEFDIVADGINRKLQLQKSKHEDEKDLTLQAQLIAAKRKQNDENQKLDEEVTVERKKQIDKQVADEVDGENQWLSAEKNATDVSEKLYQDLNVAIQKGEVEQARNSAKQQQENLQSQILVADAEVKAHRMTVFEKMALDTDLRAEQKLAAQDALAVELSLLEAEDVLESKKHAKRIQLLAQEKALEDKIDISAKVAAIESEDAAWKVVGADSQKTLQTQIDETRQAIQLLQDEGASIAALGPGIEKLTSLWMKQTEQSSKAGTIEVSAIRGIQQAYNQLAGSIANAIVNVKSFGDLGKTVLKAFEQEILTQVIGAILKMAANWVTAKLGMGAASKAQAVQESAILHQGQAEKASAAVGSVFAQSGLAFAAQFADVMASVPYPANLATAPAMALAAMGEVQSIGLPLASLAAFDMGGLVPETMIATVHKGEYISTAADTSRALVGGGGGGISITLNGPFNGVTHNLVNDIGNQIVYKIRQMSGNRNKF